MKDFKIPSFTKFVVENYGHDDDTFATTEVSDDEQSFQRYQHALRYIIHMLSSLGQYNFKQATVLVDRTVRKFDLNDEQKRNLEVDIFDWENRDNDDMNAGIEEKHEYRHSPTNMKGYIDKIFKSGRSHVRNYQEFKIPVQK